MGLAVMYMLQKMKMKSNMEKEGASRRNGNLAVGNWFVT